MFALETSGLTKYYSNGRIKALEDVSLQIEEGRIFSLLGPNGAGKTTLIKLLLGIALPTRGTAAINGTDIRFYRSHSEIGYLAENHRFPDYLTASQTLYYFGRMCGVETGMLSKRIPELMHLVKLSDWSRTRIRKFSKGMLQRLGIAQALINDPRMVFLDEPTDGIDPVGRREIRDLILNLKKQGKTIFLNSHLLSEVERISDEIAILKLGRLVEKGSVETFLTKKAQYRISIGQDPGALESMCKTLGIPLACSDGQHVVKVDDEGQLNVLIDRLRADKITIKAIIPYTITLEDFFIDILETGGERQE